MDDEVEDRREQVINLLSMCASKKLLKDGTEAARRAAERAHELATASPALPTPWPQLAAYRLARLILRNDPEEEDLHRADELLRIAMLTDGEEDVLGPMPRLYRLAVMHRLNSGESLTKVVFENAIKSVSTMLSTERGDRESSLQKQVRGPLQHGLFNMLELATYFLGFSYPKQLEGREGLFQDLMLGDSSWMLAGHNPRVEVVWMPRELARAELDARGRSHPGALLFRLSKDKAEWRIAEHCDWTAVNDDQIRLLANLVRANCPVSSGEIRPRIVEEDDDPESSDRPSNRFRS